MIKNTPKIYKKHTPKKKKKPLKIQIDKITFELTK